MKKDNTPPAELAWKKLLQVTAMRAFLKREEERLRLQVASLVDATKPDDDQDDPSCTPTLPPPP